MTSTGKRTSGLFLRSSPKPKAYVLAARGGAKLRDRYSDLQAALKARNTLNCLSGFEQLVQQASIATNMSLAGCVRFFETGRLLNIYEVESRKTGRTGSALFRSVKKRIPEWFLQRREIERLLRFRLDSHYAYLNTGGPGPTRYGVCGVIFDIKKCIPYRTCCAGDTLRAVFDATKRRILSDAEVLEKFATHDDVSTLACVCWPNLIEADAPSFSRARAVAAMEASDSLIEVHFHGPVLSVEARAVHMDVKAYTRFWDLAARADLHLARHGGPLPQEYDAVPAFKKLVDVLQHKNVPLVTVN